tara:strand:- start:82 stop:297 length:216 start_codon:yes stop_codon:yes gene_type:complete
MFTTTLNYKLFKRAPKIISFPSDEGGSHAFAPIFLLFPLPRGEKGNIFGALLKRLQLKVVLSSNNHQWPPQ